MIKKIIGDALVKVIDDVGEIFLKKPGGKSTRVTDPNTAKKMIQDGAKVVSQAPIRNARSLTAREREAISGLGGQAAGVARTISRGKTSIGELVKSGQRAKPRGMGDRKLPAVRPKPPAKRGQTMPVPKPKPKPPAKRGQTMPVPKPKPKPPARAGGSGGGRPPGGSRPMPGARPGQRPPRVVGVTRGSQAGAAARQAAILSQIQKNLEDAADRGPKPASAAQPPKRKPTGTYDRSTLPTSKPKATKRAKPKGMADRKSAPVSAGKNVGFGPKGNIFPSNAEERKALMLMYGGTGSKAGKAAMAGKQGNIAKGRAAYEAAKRKRLTAKKKTGGSFSSKKIPIVTVGPKGGKNKGKVVGTANKVTRKKGGGKVAKNNSRVGRQVKGFGAARRPKK